MTFLKQTIKILILSFFILFPSVSFAKLPANLCGCSIRTSYVPNTPSTEDVTCKKDLTFDPAEKNALITGSLLFEGSKRQFRECTTARRLIDTINENKVLISPPQNILNKKITDNLTSCNIYWNGEFDQDYINKLYVTDYDSFSVIPNAFKGDYVFACKPNDLNVLNPIQTETGFTEGNLSEIEAILNKPQLQIKIPGLSFSGEGLKAIEDDDGSKYFVVPFLGEYISAVYKFSVVAGSIFAVIMIIIAGMQWMIPGNITSSGGGDSKETINKAKKRIAGAITGLILLVGSYTLLYTINPNLVEFHGLKVQFVKPEPFSEVQDVGFIDADFPFTGEKASNLVSPSQVTENSFGSFNGTDGLNKTEQNSFNIWSSLTEEQKNLIVVEMFIVPPESFCSGVENLPILGKGSLNKIPGFTKQKIHPSMYQKLLDAKQKFNDRGFDISGKIFRTITRQAEKWNTGLVRRYKENNFNVQAATKENRTNLGHPTCQGGHMNGAAVDITLRDNKDNVLLKMGTPAFRQGSYEKYMFNDGEKSVYRLFMERIMSESGFVRYCAEHWHFESGITERFNSWDKSSKCWFTKSSWDKPIPPDIAKKVGVLYNNKK